MSIRYFGREPQIDVTTSEELHEALDILHTQVIDNLPEEAQAPLLRILEAAMEQVEALPAVARKPAAVRYRERMAATEASRNA